MSRLAHVKAALDLLPSKFNVIRCCIYTLVILWSIVCLAIAAHFESVLASSDLTRFVPFALFVSCTSMVVMFCLCVFAIWRNMNPIGTRVELACLGLVGTFWLALGAFLASSDAKSADVECFTSEDVSTPVEDGAFSTETYQAQYHVLEAFSLFNTILLWAFLLTLFTLAIRRYMAGDKDVWVTPVPNVAWFGGSGKSRKRGGKLPAPVTAQGKNSRRDATSRAILANPALPVTRERSDEKPQRGYARPAYDRTLDEHYVWIPRDKEKAPPNAVRSGAPSRENTRSTNATRYSYDRGAARNTTTRTAEPPSRNNTRSTNATYKTAGSRNTTRSAARPAEQDTGRALERTNSNSRQPGRSNSNSRKPDYYRRDLSPRR